VDLLRRRPSRSSDLVHWTKHPRILEMATRSPGRGARCGRRPIVAQDGRYFLFFGANDIQNDAEQIGGIGVAVADKPEGPFPITWASR
jgi:hypothetical protein